MKSLTRKRRRKAGRQFIRQLRRINAKLLEYDARLSDPFMEGQP